MPTLELSDERLRRSTPNTGPRTGGAQHWRRAALGRADRPLGHRAIQISAPASHGRCMDTRPGRGSHYFPGPSHQASQVPMVDPWRAASDPSAMPRRLLITKSDAAELLGVSLRTIERLISAGRLPLVHVEGSARVRVTDLEAYVQGLEAQCGTQPTPSSQTYASPAPPPSSQHHDEPPAPSAPRSTSIT